jgi:hypothetical protein
MTARAVKKTPRRRTWISTCARDDNDDDDDARENATWYKSF